jgi:hypothetical protein
VLSDSGCTSCTQPSPHNISQVLTVLSMLPTTRRGLKTFQFLTNFEKVQANDRWENISESSKGSNERCAADMS